MPLSATAASSVPDVCIIGAGLAGGVMAHALATLGQTVVVLDAGPRFPPGRMAALRQRLDTGRSPWSGPADRDRFTNAGATAYPLNDYRVKGIGGTTLHWTAYTPRFHDDDFALRSRHGLAVDWPVAYGDLEPFYGQAEAALGVSGRADNPFAPFRSTPYPLDGFPHSAADAVLGAACTRAGITAHHVPFARSSVRWGARPRCMAFSTCASHQVCPISAQYTAETHVALAEATGRVTVRPECVARRFELDRQGRVRAVIYADGDATEAAQPARAFVLAAHAVESARLLLLSTPPGHDHGLANRSGLVGRHLMEHPLWAVHGRLDQPLHPYRIGFHTMETQQFCSPADRGRVGAFRLAFPNQAGPMPAELAASGEAWGDGLVADLNASFGRVAAVHGFTEQLPDPNNTVTLDPVETDRFGDPVPRLTWGLGDYDRAAGDAAMATAARILDAAGATDIERPFGDGFSFCGHQIGTVRMGADPAQSVVDRDLVCHDVPNLMVVGSAVFPTSSSLNPSLTIAALTLRAARRVPGLL